MKTELTPEEKELIALSGAELKNHPPLPVELRPMAAYALVANLQLACRHPENPLKEVAEEYGREIQSLFDSNSATYKVLNLGWDSERDIELTFNQKDSEQAKTEIHNVFTLYELDEEKNIVEEPVLSFFRPQDWGNKERWHYYYCKLEVGKYICHCHLWQEKERSIYEACRHIGQYLFMFLQPGTPAQLCGRDCLDEDDFWLKEWGEQPEYYYADDEVYL